MLLSTGADVGPVEEHDGRPGGGQPGDDAVQLLRDRVRIPARTEHVVAAGADGHEVRRQGQRRLQLFVDDRTVDSHIKRMRRKFRSVDDEFAAIETFYGAGYSFADG